MNFEDITLQCADCGCEFVFSASEQEFYHEKGLTNSPRRCKECRNARKNRNSYSRRDSYQKPMYDVICSECGCQTQVPFKPSGDRPVYCKDCFRR